MGPTTAVGQAALVTAHQGQCSTTELGYIFGGLREPSSFGGCVRPPWPVASQASPPSERCAARLTVASPFGAGWGSGSEKVGPVEWPWHRPACGSSPPPARATAWQSSKP